MAAPEPQQRGGGNMLMQKLGPLATWVWLLIATVLIGVYYLYEKHKQGTAGTSTSTSTTASTANASQVPDIILQDYGAPVTQTVTDNPPPGSVPPPQPPVRVPPPIRTPGVPPPKPPAPKPPVTKKKAPAPKPKPQQYATVTVAKWTSSNTPWNSTLSGIADHYHVSGGYQALAKLNGIKNPNLIYPGQKIKVPT